MLTFFRNFCLVLSALVMMVLSLTFVLAFGILGIMFTNTFDNITLMYLALIALAYAGICSYMTTNIIESIE